MNVNADTIYQLIDSDELTSHTLKACDEYLAGVAAKSIAEDQRRKVCDYIDLSLPGAPEDYIHRKPLEALHDELSVLREIDT